MFHHSMVVATINLQQVPHVKLKFSIRPYMTHVSKPIIEIKDVAGILKHGDVTCCCSSLRNKQAAVVKVFIYTSPSSPVNRLLNNV